MTTADGSARDHARLREADSLVTEGEQSQLVHDTLLSQSRRAIEAAETKLEQLPRWESVEIKEGAWGIIDDARHMAEEARRNLGIAEATFLRALGLVPDHLAARRALSTLYFRQLELAEEEGDRGDVLKYRELARRYDTGELAYLLDDVGNLEVETDLPGLPAKVERFEERRGRLMRVNPRDLGRTTTEAIALPSGSYIVTVQNPRVPQEPVRYPVMVKRAATARVKLHIPAPGEIPAGFVYVPGGPFIARPDPKGLRTRREHVPDFAIARFPVTFREYSAFLESMQGVERTARTPHTVLSSGEPFMLLSRDDSGIWQVDPRIIEGPARQRIPREADFEVPVYGISWFDAVAYTEWLATMTRRPYRLPTDLEWEKAARGADGRFFPMGQMLDPAFAKLRESRREPNQPEPVGAFSQDESPFGVRDMTGGIGEFTMTPADGEGPLPDDRDPSAYSRLAIYRGGSWGSTAALRNAMRYALPILERTVNVGFRVALTLTGASSDVFVTED